MTPATRRAIDRLATIRQAERSRRMAAWMETVARIQGTPARTDEERQAKRVALESLRDAL